jgi:O-antigen/teichoic acid export membrane protein
MRIIVNKITFELVASMLIQAFYALSQLLVLAISAALLDVESFGGFGIMFTVFILVQSLSTNGLENYIFSKCDDKLDEATSTGLNDCLKSFYDIYLKLLILALPIFFFFTNYFRDKFLVYSLCLLCPLVIIPVISYKSALLRCKGFNLIVVFLNNVIRPLMFVFLAIVYYMFYGDRGVSALSLFIMFSFPFFLLLIFYNNFFSSKLNMNVGLLRDKWSAFTNPLGLKVFLFSAPPFLVLLNSQLDVLLVGMLMPMSEVAIYKVASSISSVFLIPLTGVVFYLSPRLRSMLEGGEGVALIKSSIRIAFLISVCAYGGFFLIGDYLIIMTFGDQYLGAFSIGLILGIGTLFSVAAGINLVSLLVLGMHMDAIRYACIIIIVNISLNMLLIPVLGYAGAAVSTVFSTILMNVLLTLKVRKETKINISII